MAGGFKFTLLSDVRGFLKGTTDVEQALDDVADSLDDLARDTEADADKAADALERKFRDAFDEVKTDAKDAGKKIGDEVEDGTRRASEGVDDFKSEAKQSARESAASFSGEFEDVGDLVQETLANALGGFGPIGAAAGIAAAAGFGALMAKLEEVQEQTEAYRENVAGLAAELLEVGGNLNEADLKSYIQNLFLEGLDQGTTRLKKWTDAGIDADDSAKALTGDADAQARVIDDLNARYLELGRQYAAGDATATRLMGTNREMLYDFQQQTAALTEASDAARVTADATDGLSESQRRAAETSAEFSDALTDHLSVADEGLDRFVKKGKLNLNEWAAELKRRAKETELVEDFSVDVAPKLSPKALENFAKLPTETQAEIARSYKSGNKKDRAKIEANLEAEAKVRNVTIDTSKAQVAADPVEVPTTIDASGLPREVQDAADDAQRVANRKSNEIEFGTRIDADELQRQVNRAAASISSPTVWVNVKARKEVP